MQVETIADSDALIRQVAPDWRLWLISANARIDFVDPQSMSITVLAAAALVERATRVTRRSATFVTGSVACHEPPDTVAALTRSGHPSPRLLTPSPPQRQRD
jgi:hypothetical protein